MLKLSQATYIAHFIAFIFCCLVMSLTTPLHALPEFLCFLCSVQCLHVQFSPLLHFVTSLGGQ